MIQHGFDTRPPEQIPEHVDPAAAGLGREDPVVLEDVDPDTAQRVAFEHGDIIETAQVRYD